jgi:hypothetical protein
MQYQPKPDSTTTEATQEISVNQQAQQNEMHTCQKLHAKTRKMHTPQKDTDSICAESIKNLCAIEFRNSPPSNAIRILPSNPIDKGDPQPSSNTLTGRPRKCRATKRVLQHKKSNGIRSKPVDFSHIPKPI